MAKAQSRAIGFLPHLFETNDESRNVRKNIRKFLKRTYKLTEITLKKDQAR